MRGRTLLEAIAARRAVDKLVLQHDCALLQLDGTEGEQLRESIVRELTEVIRHLTAQPLKPVCATQMWLRETQSTQGRGGGEGQIYIGSRKKALSLFRTYLTKKKRMPAKSRADMVHTWL